METVNVDIRKLQLLNDRINQTIDALNQVRLSVHGLQHTMPAGQNLPWGYQANIPTPQVPVGTIPVAPFGYGISHTTLDPRMMGAVDPRMTGTVDPRLMGTVDPRLMGIVDPRLQDPRFLTSPMIGIGGLSHTVDPAFDPFWRQRLLQTFPYATAPYAPVF